MTKHWLMKTEPCTFSITDLANRPNGKEGWDGVRNYQARNFMRDDMCVGDDVLIYHSSCKNVGIAGLARVSLVNLADPTQFNPDSKYFDPKATPQSPRWWMVEVEHVKTFDQVIALSDIKAHPQITQLPLVKKGSRLSIMPVQPNEFSALMAMVHAAL